MGGVPIVVDALEPVVGVDQWMRREVEERKRTAMQSVEATAGDAVLEIAAVVVEVVVEVDKSSSAKVISDLKKRCSVEKI
jgi:hypothetical protein